MTETIEATIVECEKLPAVQHAGPRVIGGLPHLDAYVVLAERVARTAMVPSAFRNKPDEVLAVVLYGAELGVGPMQALQQINFIEGKPAVSPELMRALIRQAGHKLSITSTRTSCVIAGERGDTGEVGETDFTIDDAVDASLCRIVDGKVQARSQSGKKLPWETYTKDMLLARATSRIARMMFSDVIAGMSYTPEEVESFSPPAPRPRLGPVTTRRESRKDETGEVATSDQLYAITTALGLLEANDKAKVKALWIEAGLPSLARGLASAQAEYAIELISNVLNDVGGAVDAEVIAPGDADSTTTATASVVDAPLATTTQVRAVQTLLSKLEIGGVDRHDYVGAIIDRQIESMNDLTKDEAHTVIDTLTAQLADASSTVH